MSNPSRPRVLIVDDQLSLAATLAEGLVDRGFDAHAMQSAPDAAAELERANVDALVTDLRMQPLDGLALLAHARKLDPDRPVIVMTAYGAVDSAVESIRRGAYHYLTKPFKLDELAIFLRRALDEVQLRHEAGQLRAAMAERFAAKELIGRSRAMATVHERIARLADANAPVLIVGETGTGKSLVAAAMHGRSRRASGPFVTVNCASLPETLLESELFGHVRGAFTGAIHTRTGLFVDADAGTLFLDEVAEMSLALQAKLLDVIERQKVRPVGGSKEREVDVRILAATHRDLHERVREGTFRQDLLYRLDVVSIELPALRARADDIPELVEHFLAGARAQHPESKLERFSSDAMKALASYAWPGNVRELAHVIERAVLLATSAVGTRDDLPDAVASGAEVVPIPMGGEVLPIREVQRSYARWALRQSGGNKSRTAEKLGIDHKTLLRWLGD